jgi:hypothetical protein
MKTHLLEKECRLDGYSRKKNRKHTLCGMPVYTRLDIRDHIDWFSPDYQMSLSNYDYINGERARRLYFQRMETNLYFLVGWDDKACYTDLNPTCKVCAKKAKPYET